MKTPVPAFEAWLGAAGLIPFGAAALGVVAGPETHREQATLALLGYGAVILSFLGGVLWGAAISRAKTLTGKRRRFLLAESIAPALLGWLALLIGGAAGIYLLALSFLAVFVRDRINAGWGVYPPWYPRLRLPLTAGVLVCTLASAMAA